MQTTKYFSQLNEHDLAALHLEQITPNFGTPRLFIGENLTALSVDDDDESAKLHLIDQNTTNRIRNFERKAMARWLSPHSVAKDFSSVKS
jgi:hypothetical protein